MSEEWCKKYAELMKMVARVNQLREKVQRLPHPGVVYDLTPYLTEINAVLAMVLDYFRWLESGVMSYRTFGHLRRLLTWFSPGYSEMAMSGEHEPWMFRGGLITEIQRILPLESAQDLFPAPSRVGPLLTTTPVAVLPPPQPGAAAAAACAVPIPPSADLPGSKRLLEQPPDQRPAYFQPRRPYLVRPYRPDDKPKLYSLWRRLLLRRMGLSADALPEEYKDLPGDRRSCGLPGRLMCLSGDARMAISDTPMAGLIARDLNLIEPLTRHGTKGPQGPVCHFSDFPRYLLSYLEHSPQHCLVVEGPPLYFMPPLENQTSTLSQPQPETSEWGIVGFALAAPDVAAWARDREELCRTYLRERYPRLNPVRSTLGESSGILQLQRKPSISGILSLSTEDLIALCTEWFHNERVPKTTSAIAEAAINDDLPEPLGAGINDQAMAVEVESIRSFSDELPKPEEQLKEDDSQPLAASDASVSESNPVMDPGLEPVDAIGEQKGAPIDQPSMGSPVLPPAQPSSINDSSTPVPSATAGSAELIPPNPLTEACVSGRPVVSGQMEAIHSALIAHPATIFVELDDCDFGNQPGVPTPLMMMNHHMGLAFDPPELVLDEVARRLFVCLLAGLKTWACNGVHVELDSINEPRADLYRRFGFYPVAAASTDFTSVLARLI
ncbi:unnamed protein product [Schistocephalus solidus]|uniref:ORF 72 n=1 Tax=Schistocephalus solidus TaxID=70667 RepID=A0A183T587_SCHSO|nr:unnamed protein product [Schistocephalus solidus]